MMVLDVTPSSYVFDGSHPSLMRDRLWPIEDRASGYDSRYDFNTFFYDCYYDDETRDVRLICPNLLNFQFLLPDCVFRADGQDVLVVAVEALSRGSVIRLSVSGVPEVLEIEHPLFKCSVPVGRQHLDMFAGKNALYAISKDNPLAWIKDWLRYYVAEHGANGVVLYDNQSTAYSMEALGEAIKSVPGIDAAVVVRAWFPFGPGGTGPVNFNSKFLHMTMVELGRQRFLKQARAVLNVDIDEFVYSRSGQSVFDATLANPDGYVRIDGRWVYADAPDDGTEVRHASHRYVDRGKGPKINRKWCVSPTGPLKKKLWRTHRIKSLKDPTDPDFGFWHFRHISNGWDYARDGLDVDAVQEDPRLIDTMARVFRL